VSRKLPGGITGLRDDKIWGSWQSRESRDAQNLRVQSSKAMICRNRVQAGKELSRGANKLIGKLDGSTTCFSWRWRICRTTDLTGCQPLHLGQSHDDPVLRIRVAALVRVSTAIAAFPPATAMHASIFKDPASRRLRSIISNGTTRRGTLSLSQ
jgi:hypothetical protein